MSSAAGAWTPARIWVRTVMMPVLFAFLLTVLFTIVFALAFPQRGARSSTLAFFLMVFLSAWAASLWLGPAGPVLLGIYWVPIAFVALIVAAVLAGRHSQRQRQRGASAPEAGPARPHELAFNAVFWMVVLGLVAIIVLGYLLAGPAAGPAS
jgi:hypothetical protein